MCGGFDDVWLEIRVRQRKSLHCLSNSIRISDAQGKS